MAKNIEMQYYTGSAYEVCYPKVLLTNVTGTLPISNGGTGATSASAARTALGCSATGHNHAGDSLNPASVELRGTSSHGGYIDFHYGATTNDYTARIIESSSGVLNITGSKLQVNGTTVSLEGHTHSGSGLKGAEYFYWDLDYCQYDNNTQTYSLTNTPLFVVIETIIVNNTVRTHELHPAKIYDRYRNYTYAGRILVPNGDTQYFDYQEVGTLDEIEIPLKDYEDRGYGLYLSGKKISLYSGRMDGGLVCGFSLY